MVIVSRFPVVDETRKAFTLAPFYLFALVP